MNYIETLRKAEELGINPIMLAVAHELDCQIDGQDIALTPTAFEEACYLIERAYLRTCAISIDDITRALINMLVDNNTPLHEIDIWDLLQKSKLLLGEYYD